MIPQKFPKNLHLLPLETYFKHFIVYQTAWSFIVILYILGILKFGHIKRIKLKHFIKSHLLSFVNFSANDLSFLYATKVSGSLSYVTLVFEA